MRQVWSRARVFDSGVCVCSLCSVRTCRIEQPSKRGTYYNASDVKLHLFLLTVVVRVLCLLGFETGQVQPKSPVSERDLFLYLALFWSRPLKKKERNRRCIKTGVGCFQLHWPLTTGIFAASLEGCF